MESIDTVQHGNKAATSPTGSADLLLSLGAQLAPLTPRYLNTVFSQTRFAFLFAPTYHPGMSHVAPVRKEIGIRTIFNILGPLCNPADIDARVIGVPSQVLGEVFAETLRLMGVKRALVVCGYEGLDEISPEGKTHVWKLDKTSKLEYFSVEPADFGITEHPIGEVKSGTPPENAALLLKILDGEVPKGNAVLDFVLLNAAALLVCTEKAKDWKDGVRIAEESIKSGNARKALDGFIKGSTEVAETVTKLKSRSE
jgi:anthranilate phosphoribosyltransferase